MIGITLDELLRHIAHEAHQVLLAELGIQSNAHVPWLYILEGIEVHIHLGIDVRIRCLQG